MKVRVTIEMEVPDRETWPEHQRGMLLETKIAEDYDWMVYLEEGQWDSIKAETRG